MLTRGILLDDLLAVLISPRSKSMNETVSGTVSPTPDSPDLAMVREQIPLHASQNLISWSYDPVTRMTDMSCRAELLGPKD
jgi:hypothetical protein